MSSSVVVITVLEDDINVDQEAPSGNTTKLESTDEKLGSGNCSCIPQLGLMKAKLMNVVMKAWGSYVGDKKEKDKVQQVVHSLKVGMALGLVSLLMLLKAPDEWLGNNAIWADMTVCAVFETSVGATISKGLNRTVATLVAGFLAVGVEKLVDISGHPWSAIFIGASVVLVASLCTSMRFVPSVKAKYDYGLIIFMLTYALILVTGYRVADDLRLAWERLFVSSVGVVVCVVTSMSIYPAWAGTDLHNAVVANFDDLASILKECASDFVKGSLNPNDLEETPNKDDIVTKFNAILGSGSWVDSMEKVALWEPFHGKFRFHHPWHEYVKLGKKLQHCALAVLTLDGCLRSVTQMRPSSIPAMIKSEMTSAMLEASKLLKELGESIRSFHRCENKKLVTKSMRHAASNLRSAIENHVQPTFTTKFVMPQTRDPTFRYETFLRSAKLATSRKPTIRRTSSCSSLHKEPVSPPPPPLQYACKQAPKLLKLKSPKPPETVEGFEAVSFATFTYLLDEIVNRLDEVVDVVEGLGAKAKFDAITDTTLVDMESSSHRGAEKTIARRRRKAIIKI